MEGGDYDLAVPVELATGVYAHTLYAWHTVHEFTLDFGVRERDDPSQPYLGVARVRVPVTLMFEMIRILNADLTRYEQRFGEISPPGAA